MTWTPPAATCVRRAWLTLGSLSVGLEGPGWFCPSLDLGYPDVRDVTSNRPDQDGIDDRTMYMGGRTVTAEIVALAGAGAQIDAVVAMFAPFMAPSARPVLHYVLDRPGAPERTMTLRAAGFSGPIAGAYERDVQLQWVAADPAAYDPTVRTATAWAGSASAPGRVYPLAFNRVYPAGGASPTSATMVTPGDLMAWPLLRVYGPIAGALVRLQNNWPDNSWVLNYVRFLPSYTIGAGHYVDVDTFKRTAYLDGDRTQNVVNQIDWSLTSWPYLMPSPAVGTLLLSGTNASGVTQVQATWQDRYLT